MNTIATLSYREKYFKSTLETALRAALVAEKICQVDRSDAFVIRNPYQTAPTTVVAALTGAYTVSAYTTTNDSLTITDTFSSAEHVYDHENLLNNYDMFAARMDDLMYSVKASIDNFVINYIGTDGTGTYTTPTGGFTTAANINVICSNLLSKVAGYSETYHGTYLVIESTDIPGFVQAQATNGFNFADSALRNGLIGNYMGIDIFVVPSGSFTSGAIGTKTMAMSAHRLFGVKNMCTYAAPRGVQYEEKSVSAKTGKEIVIWGYIGVAAWIPKRALTVDITLA